MRKIITIVGTVILGLLVARCAEKLGAEWKSFQNPVIVARLKSFIAEKEAQANATTNSLPPEFKAFFAVARQGDWLAVSNQFEDFRKHAGQYEHSGKTDERLRGPAWEAVKEIWGALYDFNVSGEKYSAAFGNGIIASIPAGSIYFGGTDPGRFIVTALQKSHVGANPFFTLTQNALADSTYLDYLRSMYGGKIYIPTADDSQKCFQDYTEDVARRQQSHQLRPGEDVTVTDGRVQVSGQVPVMIINGLLARVIFDKNPNREFYVEESFPLEWMYPYLEPHGLIMKINRRPLTSLPDEIVNQDHDYWSKQLAPMIGDWLNADTPLQEVVTFAEKVYTRNDLAGFHGDQQFFQSPDAQKMFSKLRSSQGGLYAWRLGQYCPPEYSPKSKEEVQVLIKEADFAFRQSWALCPYSMEAVYRYVNFLLMENRVGDALLVAETAAKMPELNKLNNFYGDQIRNLIEHLKHLKQ